MVSAFRRQLSSASIEERTSRGNRRSRRQRLKTYGKSGLPFLRSLRCEQLEERTLLSAAPTVIGTTPSLVGGALLAGTASLQVQYSANVSGGASSDNYQLQSLGPDGLLGTPDDTIVPLSASYSGATATLNFAALPESVYRLTVKDSIVDAFGNALDGDSDSAAGGDWVHDFVANRMPVALDPSFDGDGKAVSPFQPHDLRDQRAYSVAMTSDGKLVVAGSAANAANGTNNDFEVMRYNADGSLDKTFDGDGMVTTAFGTKDDYGYSVAVQSDGKIVVAGDSLNGSNNYDFAVVRYNTDGSLDTTFDGDGKLTTAVGTSNDYAYGVTVQSDGKIVVAGYSTIGSNYDFAMVRYNANGSLDTTFDGDGKLTTAVGTSNDYAYGVAVQSDGKIVVAGYSTIGSNYDFAMVRYNANGSLDTTFDGDGKLTTAVGASNDYGRSVALQSDGKIIVAGYSSNGTNNDFAVVRYSANGTLDTTFDGDGKVTTAIGAGDDLGYSVALQPDSKIIVAGYSSNGTNNDFAVVRYSANGTLDTTFDGDGKLTTAIGAGDDCGYGAVLKSDGKVVVAGSSSNGSDADFALVRYNPDGALDTTFDDDGKLTTGIVWTSNTGCAVAMQPDGKTVLAGQLYDGKTVAFAVLRYNVDGSLDATFGGDGEITTTVGPGDAAGRSVALQPDGKIVVAGFSQNSGNYDFTVVRYNPDGSLDPSFDGDGKVITAIGPGDDVGQSVALQPDGKIVVAGYSYSWDGNGHNHFAVVRYNANGSLDTSFDLDGKLTTAVCTSSDYGQSVALQPDGKIVVAGYSYNGSNVVFAVVRYNTDGSLDTSFGADGKLTTPVSSSNDHAHGVAVQSDGKIVVAGESYNGSTYDFAAVRYNTNGSLDTTFDGDGKLTTRVGASNDYCQSVALQPDGKILMAGLSSNGNNNDFTVVRYNSDGTLDASFNADGKLTTDFGASGDVGNSVVLQSDGKIVVAGNSSTGTTTAFAVARYGARSANLPSSHGLDFDIDVGNWGAGQVISADGAANGLNRLQVDGTDYAPAASYSLDDDGRTVVTGAATLSGLNVQREITVPNRGNEDFARTVDVFENPTGSPITTTVCLIGNLGSDGATTVFNTSDGDTTIEMTDQWIGTDDADGTGSPAVIHYIHGRSGLQPTSVIRTGDNIEWTYNLTVPAGQTIRLAHYTILATTRSQAEAGAAALVTGGGFGGQAAAFLSTDEANSLGNFQFNHAPLAASGGPYVVEAGNILSLIASGATDPDASSGDRIVTYAWDLNGDGQYDDLVTTDATATAPYSQIASLGLGSHPMGLQVTDTLGLTGTATTTLSIVDTTPPVISGVPADMVITVRDPGGAVATWSPPTANDLVDGFVAVTAVPASGTAFPLGTTTVILTAEDLRGNVSTASFHVTVRLPSSTAYVDDDWSAVPVGIDPDGAGPATEMGYDAFPTVQAGVDAVADDGTVNVAAGTYVENVVVGKPVTINGASGNAADVLIQPVSGVAIANSDYVDMALANLTVLTLNARGISLIDAAAVTLTNVVADANPGTTSSVTNLYIGADSVAITGGSFSGGTRYGIYVVDVLGAVSLTDVVADNNAWSNLYLDSVGSVSVTGGSFSGATDGSGIEAWWVVDAVTIRGVVADGNAYDNLDVYDAGSISVSDSSFNASAAGYGLYLGGVTGAVTVDGVTADGNTYGNLDVFGVDSVSVTGGSFSDSDQQGVTAASVTGAVTVDGVTANGNAYSNLLVDMAGAVIIDGSSFNDSTGKCGIYLSNVLGAAELIHVTADGNYDSNLYASSVGSIGIDASSFDASHTGSGLDLTRLDAISLENLTANGNRGGVYVENVTGSVGLNQVTADNNASYNLHIGTVASVSVTGGSFSGGDSGGIAVYSVTGAVTIAGITANDNTNGNLNVYNAGSVAISDSTFNDSAMEAGIDLGDIAGAVDLVNVTANGNYGGNFYASSVGSVTIDPSYFNSSRTGNGLCFSGIGALSMVNVTADGNCNANVTLTGAASVSVTGGSFSRSANGGGLLLREITGDVIFNAVTADGNAFDNLSVDSAASFILSGGSFSDSSGTGVAVSGVSGSAIVTDIIADGNGLGVFAFDVELTVAGGSFRGNGTGVSINGRMATIINNDIENNAFAICVYDGSATITLNNLTGNGSAWQNYSASSLNVAGNWWGRSTGPATDEVFGLATVAPWLTDGDDAEPATPGFQHAPPDNVPPTTPTIAGMGPDSGIPGDGITSSTSLSITGTAEANSTVTVFDSTVLLGVVSTDGSGAWVFEVSGLDDGSTHSYTATATDLAGNTSEASGSFVVLIDATAPITTDDVAPGWHASAVTVILTSSDSLSGTAHTYYSLDGAPAAEGGRASVTTEGDHVLSYWSVDIAGNEEARHTVHVMLDLTPPTVVSTTPSLVNGALLAGATSLHVQFTEDVAGSGTSESYQLHNLGDDGLLGTLDDTSVPVSVSYSDTTATLSFGALPEGVYRLTVKDSIIDIAGNTLDGDANGAAGGSWIRDFVVSRMPTGLDSSFDGDGTLTTSFGAGDDYGRSVAVAPDGKIVVAGNSWNGRDFDVAVARYNADGSLDASFDGDGKLTTAIGTSYDGGFSVVVQPDGKIVVAGSLWNGNNSDFAIVRYNIDGSLDATFDGDGYLTTDFDASDDSGASVALEADGKIVVAGYSRSAGGGYDFAVARYDADGSLDATFDGDGKLTVDVAGGNDLGTSVALEPDGKLLVAGYAYLNGKNHFAVVRCNADGSLDTSLDGDGKLTTGFGASSGLGQSMAIQSDGKIVLAGWSNNDVAVARYNANGALDTSFDGDGRLTTDFLASPDYANSVAIQADGKIVVAGMSRSGGNYDFAVVRYNADGSLDATLDGDGRLTTAIGASDDYSYSMVIAPDGKIVVAGYASNGSNMDFAVARYGTGSVDLHSSHGFLLAVDTSDRGSGQLIGVAGAANGLNRLQVGGSDFAPTAAYTLDDGGRTVVTGAATLFGLNVHREITVPNTGNEDFARTVDVFENPTASAITATVRIVGNLGSDGATAIFSTSDGDTIIEPTDQWIGTDDADATGTPAAIHYIHGPNGLMPTSVTRTGDNIEWTYSLTVEPGETVRLASFTIVNATQAGAIAAANALVTPTTFGGQAAAFLTDAELQSLANFVEWTPPSVPVFLPTESATSATSLVTSASPAPTSSIAALPAYERSKTFTVSWSGTAGGDAAAIASYSVYVSDNDGAFKPWKTGTKKTSAKFVGKDGHSYAFYSVAKDKTGSVESGPFAAQTTTLVDLTRPSSRVKALPAYENSSAITVSWSGTDGKHGSGIATYTIFVSDNGGKPTAWLTNVSYTLASFTGQDGHKYRFYSVASDNAGNSQTRSSMAQATTSVDLAPPTSGVKSLPTVEKSTKFTVKWSGSDETKGSGIASYTVYVSDNGGPFVPFLVGTKKTSTSFTGQNGHSYSFYSVATDKAGTVQTTPTEAQAGTKIIVSGISTAVVSRTAAAAKGIVKNAATQDVAFLGRGILTSATADATTSSFELQRNSVAQQTVFASVDDWL